MLIKQGKMDEARKWVLKKWNQKPSKQTDITNQEVETEGGERRRTDKREGTEMKMVNE